MRSLCLPTNAQARQISGLVPSSLGWVLAELLRSEKRSSFMISASSHEAEQWMEAYHLFADPSAPRATFLPPPADIDAEEKRRFETACDRLQVLEALLAAESKRPSVIFTSLAALLHPVPSPQQLKSQSLTLKCGGTGDPRSLGDQLARDFGYSNEAVCEAPGQFALRGGLLDVYPLQAGEPFRIDFFGDEIESIRTFDPTTQRSEKGVEGITLLAGTLLDAGKHSLAEYRTGPTAWFFQDLTHIKSVHGEAFQIPERIAATHRHLGPWWEGPSGTEDSWTDLAWLDTLPASFPATAIPLRCETEGVQTFLPYRGSSPYDPTLEDREENQRLRYLEQLFAWQRAGEEINILYRYENEKERILTWIQEVKGLAGFKPTWITGTLTEGFRLRSSKDLGRTLPPQAFTTTHEILGQVRAPIQRLQQRRIARHSQVDQLLNFSELEEGSAVVHLAHGICLFRGMRTIDGKEVLTVEFAEKALLHVPLHESHLLTRYVGLSKSLPKLARLGSGAWEKTRRIAEEATLDYASQLLRLQAERETRPGYAFSPDHLWQERFERTFSFRETPDQLTAIQQTKADMERTRPMDRLICGDVGFGKTEVALRAAFKAVMDGKQVAILVPTTVLCQQHFNQFRERMSDFPLKVEMLSRFRTPKERKLIKEGLKNGAIDVVVGTHALIAPSIEFKDLGLLVIDEEQRFGVKHKEKLKELKRNVDVLTLSATPIPRTLYLALSGARDLSVMETPPVDRRPIETYVRTYDLEIIQKAIQFELDRGGQVFYLHNRVQTINDVAVTINKLFPDRNVGIGHGQMPEEDLERVMTDFVRGHYDILVCTTIIESGLDIPNCNTLIIEGADRFGLSQLYQIRGRVGRFRRQAYAYLLLHKHAALLDPARKRLDAIKQYSHLGAGYRIAMRDLELRGAGNLLGSAQSGMIAGIGFELYCQLLQQSISRLKGDKSSQLIRTSLRLDFIAQGEGESEKPALADETPTGYRALKAAQQEGVIEKFRVNIPSEWIPEPKLRIDYYRKLAMAATEEDVSAIADSLQDRFGRVPEAAIGLIRLAQIRTLAQSRGIVLVETEGNILKCRRYKHHEDPFVRIGSRFPRLTSQKPALRLKEIWDFLRRLPPLE
jgi:transcription-repair coupling factor (superfamily II helicase)